MLKNKTVLVIVLILLLGAIAYNVHFFYKRMHTPRSTSATLSRPPTPPSAKSPGPEPLKSPVKTSLPVAETPTGETRPSVELSPIEKKRPLFLKWGRNPFFSPEELVQLARLEHPSEAPTKKKEEISLILSGIITVSKEKMAILNDHVMLEGETIGEIKLLKIMPSAVWVSVAGHRQWVPLPQPHVTLIAQDIPGTSHQVTKEKKR